MKLLVGLLIIMLLGGVWGVGEWNGSLFADGDSLGTDTDSVMMIFLDNDSVLDNGECLEEDCDTTSFAEYVSPFIPATNKPLKSFYSIKRNAMQISAVGFTTIYRLISQNHLSRTTKLSEHGWLKR